MTSWPPFTRRGPEVTESVGSHQKPQKSEPAGRERCSEVGVVTRQRPDGCPDTADGELGADRWRDQGRSDGYAWGCGWRDGLAACASRRR